MISVPKAGKLNLVEQMLRQNEDKICGKLLPRRNEPEERRDDGEIGVIYIYIYIYIYIGYAKKIYTHFNERKLYVV